MFLKIQSWHTTNCPCRLWKNYTNCTIILSGPKYVNISSILQIFTFVQIFHFSYYFSSILELSLLNLTVFKETRNLVSGIKYISKDFFMIFVAFYLLFPFLYWHQLAQIYMYQQLSFNCKALIYASNINTKTWVRQC